jgi:hypothetical protein
MVTVAWRTPEKLTDRVVHLLTTGSRRGSALPSMAGYASPSGQG